MAAEKEFPMFVVDAFTNKPFGGNPAAVCLVGTQELDEKFYQKIAMEMNLSETAFVREVTDSESYETGVRFHLRWFTPTNEVPLCGHATLASAAVIFYHSGNDNQEITFDTLSGPIKARRKGSMICLDMPLNNPVPVDPEGQDEISKVIKSVVGDMPCTDILYSRTTKKLLLRLKDTHSRADLEGLSPNPQSLLAAHDGSTVKGVIVTLKGDKDNGCMDDQGQIYDFVSRYFAPWNGIPEDPVTGSAHTVLGSYWSNQLNKLSLYARQCSQRGGELHMDIRSDGRIDVYGEAVIVLKGALNL
ncbi:predicted protein [Nematostella vectensis]|uniref:Phenazine biosynthesis-like domain-containing protein n=1 Tax=Nematostella vectensis TaxID=45351 RepID=A7S540_NEMVE|nr:predicted protein [Nematostella vectensis]|eukprot:XP_001633202.1 predicted protein [Nematostella vectensis]